MAEKNQRFFGNGFFVLVLLVIVFFIGYIVFRTSKLQGVGNEKANGPETKTISPAKKYEQIPAVTDRDYIIGKNDAAVVIIEYSDLECPFCKNFHLTMQQVVREYSGKVAWVYRHFPLSFHANAQKEAEAAECAGELGGNDSFWQYIDAIYQRTTSNGTGFPLNQLGPLAEEIGLDKDKFQQCLDSGKYTQRVKDQLESAMAAGIEGTPGSIIIGKNGRRDFIAGAYPIDQVKAQIDAILKN